MANFAFCNKCRETVPAEHVERDGKIFLSKNCPKCGITETLISNNAEAYKNKRDFMGAVEYEGCNLDCLKCEHKEPDIVFIELTNRCNMNCPICITNVPSMGFEFEPDMEYFRLIFEDLSKMKKKPSVQLFGGEPTVREDLFDIIRLAKSYGLSVRVVTNGLKLADKKYCDDLMEEGVSVLISFDGFDRKLYEIFRGMPKALDLKLQALENLKNRKKGKVILMTVASKEQDIGELRRLFEFCLENKHVARGMFIMPLAHMWSPDRLDYNPERTTPEDVEELVDKVVGGGVEFIPLGSLDTGVFSKILKLKEMPFLGVHPNCESITLLVSDGKKFLPLGKFLRKGFAGLIVDLRRTGTKLSVGERISFLTRIRAYLSVFRVVVTNFNFGAAVGKKGISAFLKWMKIFFKVITGEKLKDVIRRETIMKGALQIIVLPFEDYDTTEAVRLKMCVSCFVYPDSGKNIKRVPVCAWERHKKVIMKEVAEIYNKPGFNKGLKRSGNVAEKV
ncbi:MAG: radical SAM protein [Candidatus Aureabacteria bacterium]|nr:radical SAM protein [Candidatus Auribacterota bacterium]